MRVAASLLPAQDIKVTAVWGAAPYQAYGWLDGERFYFKYKYGTASLSVGTVDMEKERSNRAQHHERAKNEYYQIEEGVLNGTEDARNLILYQMLLEVAQKELTFTINDPEVIPHLISKESFVNFGNEHEMMLDHVQAGNLFAECFHMLEDPIEERKNLYTLFESFRPQ